MKTELLQSGLNILNSPNKSASTRGGGAHALSPADYAKKHTFNNQYGNLA